MNEIEIKVVGTNNSGPALRQAAGDTDKVTIAVGRATVAMKSEEQQLSAVERKLIELRATASALGSEFQKTGNVDVLRQFKDVNEQTNEIQKFHNEFSKLGNDSGKVFKSLGTGFDDVGKDIAHKFSGSLGQGLDDVAHESTNIFKKFFSIGQEVGSSLAEGAKGALSGSGIMEKMQSLISNPVTGPAIGGIAVAVTPGILSAVGGAIQLAAGGAFLATGLAMAAKNPGVATAIGALKRDIGDGLRDATIPFQAETMKAVQTFENTFQQIMPSLKATFGAVAPMLGPLVTGISGMIKTMLPGIEEAARNSGPIFKEMSQDLPQLGKAVGDLFHDIASGGQSGAAAFHLIFMTVEALIEAIGICIKAAQLLFDVQLHPTHVLADLKAFTDLKETTQGFGSSLDAAGNSATGFSGAMDGATSATSAFGAGALDDAAAMAEWNKQFDDTISKALALNDQLAANTLNLQSIRDAFKANGATIDENTVKGAKNVQAIDSTVAGYQRQRDAAIEAGGSTAEAYAKADGVYNKQISDLQALLGTLLHSKSAAEAFMNAFYNKDVTVSVHVKVYQTGSTDVQGVTKGGIPLKGGSAFRHGGVAGAASGGLRAGMTWVGEAGPELLDLSGVAGAQIHTTGDSRRIAGGGGGYSGGGGSGMQLTMVVKAGDSSNRTRQLVDDIRDFVSIQGGDATVLGIKS